MSLRTKGRPYCYKTRGRQKGRLFSSFDDRSIFIREGTKRNTLQLAKWKWPLGGCSWELSIISFHPILKIKSISKLPSPFSQGKNRLREWNWSNISPLSKTHSKRHNRAEKWTFPFPNFRNRFFKEGKGSLSLSQELHHHCIQIDFLVFMTLWRPKKKNTIVFYIIFLDYVIVLYVYLFYLLFHGYYEAWANEWRNLYTLDQKLSENSAKNTSTG